MRLIVSDSGDSKTSPSERFLVPEDGGALKQLEKDEDGNINLKLSKKIKITDDTYIFRFAFPEDQTFGLPIGKHVIFSANINNDLCCRKYTPISTVTQKGYVDFLIKVYYANVHPRFPEGGVMSQHVDKMKIGDTMLMEGPKGRL